MLAKKPPMGWNSWNTFGANINEELIRQTADVMVSEGYLAAGYEYLVIDDCWSLRERGADGLLVPDPEKFPHGMKAVADYVHAKGLKFGMYSCAGVRTCAGYPSSFDHEFVDALTFADWGVDFLKYDFCNFPENGDCKMRYQTMSMALKASGREILFSACNWGVEEPWKWMRSIGAHMYRSTGDINDNFRSFTDIARSQIDNLCMNAPYGFNDMDMLTVGMYGKGNVGFNKGCTYEEYRMQFALWCLFGVPLMMGSDMRALDAQCAALLKHPGLIAIDQDEECRPPYLIRHGSIGMPVPDAAPGEPNWLSIPDCTYTFIRHLSGNEFVLAFFNLAGNCPNPADIACQLSDIGLPYSSGVGLEMTDVFTGETLGVRRDDFVAHVPGHDCRLYRCRLVRCDG